MGKNFGHRGEKVFNIFNVSNNNNSLFEHVPV